VQNSCTPAPGARETCLVNSYIFGQLGPYILFLLLVSGLAVFAFRQWSSWKKKWQLYVEYESDDNSDDKICYLSSGQRIVIGDDGPNSINCPGHSIRGYIYRKGNNIFLDPASASFEADEILYKQELVTERVYIDSTNIRLQAPVKGQNQNFEIKITVQR
ncbi:MAG: VWA domain-containing protein, partial [Cyanobacteria bacterium P01_F01_bin.53]